LIRRLAPSYRLGSTPLARPKDNIVIIIMESVSAEFLGYKNEEPGYMPFLDSLAKQSLFFENSFTNGKNSVHAVPSIFLGFPSFLNTPFMTSIYQNRPLNGLGTILKKHGYETAFFHGGMNGTMFFDGSSRIAGLDKFFGLNEFPSGRKHFDGVWGIPDHMYFSYFCDELGKLKAPFVAGLFTLSSHFPYTIPPQYQNRFPKGKLAIHESIGYLDESLRLFFEKAKTMPWYDSTLFVLVADHPQKHTTKKYSSYLGVNRIPHMYFHPKISKWTGIDTKKIVQQTDIFASVLDFVGIPEKNVLFFSHSVFDKDFGGRAFFKVHSNNILVRPNEYAVLDTVSDTAKVYDFSDWNRQNEITNSATREEATQEVKLWRQYFSQGMRSPEWYEWSPH